MDPKHKAKQVVYGFLIPNASDDDQKRFKEFLTKADSINFKKTSNSVEIVSPNQFKHQLNFSSIKVIAIGHGHEGGLINKKYKIIDVVKAVAKEIGESSSRVSEFRLQVCSQAKYAVKKDNEGTEKLDPDLTEALKSYKSERIVFCCPREFSYIKEGSYQDTNATSIDDYKKKSAAKTLEIGKEHSLKKDVVLSKEKGKTI